MLRDQFREAVFQRDGRQCVVCGSPGQDAHHLLERRLWSDGGYHLDNGVTLCGVCHIRAERTELSVERLREAAGILTTLLPEHLYPDHRYDKWGNVILPNGTRMVGELFFDESVQKILEDVRDQFIARVKYPRTYHLPWSPGRTKDDRVIPDVSMFEGREVVVTVKMDGENTTLYNDYLHARSLDSGNHPSRDWVKNFHAKVGWMIPGGWRVCGENLYATHSIPYWDLRSYFMAFSIWAQDRCLSWDDSLEWFELLDLEPVQEVYRGPWDESIRELKVDGEGYVVRLADSFKYCDFRTSVAKYVREDHVTTSHHWRFEQVRKNKLRE